VLEEIPETIHQALCQTSSNIEKTFILSTSLESDNNVQVPDWGFPVVFLSLARRVPGQQLEIGHGVKTICEENDNYKPLKYAKCLYKKLTQTQ
jgi:hypothetical protein